MAGILGGAEIVITPEKEVTMDEVAAALEDSYVRGKSHAVAVIAEGASFSTTDLASYLTKNKNVGFEIRLSILGHMQRGGSPSAFDRRLASLMGMSALEALLQGHTGVMTGMQGRAIQMVPLEDVTSKTREMTETYYELARVLSR
jgi:6-phosphofructokinase 1